MAALDGYVTAAGSGSDLDGTDGSRSTVARALRTTELLETILSKLSARDLFVLQRVDRPEEPQTVIAIAWFNEEFDEIGRPMQGLRVSARLPLSEMPPGQEWRIGARINDMVFEPGGLSPLYRPPNVHWKVHERHNNLVDMPKSSLGQLTRAREGDSRWLMHVIQPPVAEVSLKIHGKHPLRLWPTRTICKRDSGGVLVRDIIEELQRQLLEMNEQRVGGDEYIRVSYNSARSVCGRPMIFLNDMEDAELARRTRDAPVPVEQA
ncbi:hypothetical protein CBER1_06533 [Cercospora berteroae]|uniref:Uncharacterized protein n=1 Tax=Cercospora berteroae TaxID=357750 RepID=A0A2S6BTW8_9PEZI|nr:hypothetical protein CBER1_06533 [Cercospora berteroae]